MAIPAGTRIGVYEVVALIGKGGMGEVYRAHDTRLNRDVALKVLPEAFSRDMERMARFEREAKVLASLNHTNIAAIYGFEESGPIRALVMELVEGPTLANRILTGAIPVDEALPIARQVADAVEYAHDKNVIHRDLKPANIKVTAEGTVKVLDFGLAKALSDEVAAEDMSNSPTLSMAATRQGVILGTAAYMSPEQAKGKQVDRRTDVWAFGAVLYEMLTGKQAFHGEDVTEILVAIMAKEPAFDALPARTPPAIRNLIRRCLERNLRQRLRDVGEARILIEAVLSGAAPAEAVTTAPHKSRERLAWSLVAAIVLVALAGWGAFAHFRPAPAEAEAIRFFVSPADGWNLAQRVGAALAPGSVAVSPDGRRLALVSLDSQNRSLIWIRSLDSLTAQSLAGTEGGYTPFWSPDGRSLGFFANGKLKKIDLSGGPAVTLCDVTQGAGGTWNRDGVIVFTPSIGNTPLLKVSAAGGAPSPASKLEQGDNRHTRPVFLPDGQHFLYTAYKGTNEVGIYVGSLGSLERKFIVNAEASNVAYSRGHLLFLRERTLMAQPFDAQRLEVTGDAFPIAEQIQVASVAAGSGLFSASENGVLAYQTGAGAAGSQLVWLDRSGKQIDMLGEPGAYGDLELSPDGRRAAVSVTAGDSARNQDIWIYDVARGLRTRFTFDPVEDNASAWSPDGSRLVFSSRRKGHLDLYQRAASGAGSDESLFESGGDIAYLNWSPDGRFILHAMANATSGTGQDLWVLPLSGERKPSLFLQTQFNERYGQFSPDGRWVAYTSNESGRYEVYVAPFPGRGGKWQVSNGGGDLPRWRRNGAEIFFLDPGGTLTAATVNGKGTSFEVGAVQPLFQTNVVNGLRYPYAVAPDGQRFLVNLLPTNQASVPVTVVVNWTAGQKK